VTATLCPCCASLWTASSWSRWHLRFASPRKGAALFGHQVLLANCASSTNRVLVGSVGLLQRRSKQAGRQAGRQAGFLTVVGALKAAARTDNAVSSADLGWRLQGSAVRAINGTFPFGRSGHYEFGKMTTLRTGRQRNAGSILGRKFEAKHPHIQ
jgi:hypothetical protein